jgi:hypothetical protein
VPNSTALNCQRNEQEAIMPVFILWAGILILGGGFVIYRVIGG